MLHHGSVEQSLLFSAVHGCCQVYLIQLLSAHVKMPSLKELRRHTAYAWWEWGRVEDVGVPCAFVFRNTQAVSPKKCNYPGSNEIF